MPSSVRLFARLSLLAFSSLLAFHTPCLFASLPAPSTAPNASIDPKPWQNLLLERIELSPSENRLEAWRDLYAPVHNLDDALLQLVGDLALPLTHPPIEAEAVNSLIALAERLGHTAGDPDELIQFPPIHGPETPFIDHAPLRQLALVRLAAAKAAWQDQRPDLALTLVFRNLHLAHHALTRHEGIIPVIQTSGLWQVALDGVYWLATEPALSPDQARQLLAALHAQNGLAPLALARAIRGEFTFVVQVIVDRFPDTLDPDLLLSSLSSLGMAPAEAPAEGEPRLGSTLRPPLDKPATLTAMAADGQAFLDALAAHPHHPHGFTAAQIDPWRQRYVDELGAFLRYATEDEEPTPERLQAARTVLDRTDNPVGKLFQLFITPAWESISASLFRREAQRQALLGLLAWRLHGQPASWDELIAADLLPHPPADPFAANQPLRFSFSPPRIWSVAYNSEDNGGLGNGLNLGQPDDLVWPASLFPFDPTPDSLPDSEQNPIPNSTLNPISTPSPTPPDPTL